MPTLGLDQRDLSEGGSCKWWMMGAGGGGIYAVKTVGNLTSAR